MKRLSWARLAAIILTAFVIVPTADAQTHKTKPKGTTKTRTYTSTKTPTAPASDLPLFCLKGKVKSVTEKNYFETEIDSNGNQTSSGKTKLEFSGQITYSFSPDGFLTGYTSTNSEGIKKVTQTNDAKGRLKTSIYEGFTEGESRLELLTVKRNAAERVTSFRITEKNAPDYVIWNYAITLRPDGKISKIRHSTEYEDWTEVYKYDSNGFITSIQTLSPLGNHSLTHKYGDEKDSHGNWLKCSKDDNSVVVREIEYYE